MADLDTPLDPAAGSIYKSLGRRLPDDQLEAAKAYDVGAQIRAGSAVQGAAPTAGVREAQGAAAGAATEAGTAAVQRAGQTVQRAGQVGALGLQAQAQQGREQVAAAQRGTEEGRLTAAARTSDLDSQTKDQILGSRLQFNQDNAGRLFLNQRQLADWALTRAKSGEDLKGYQQQVEQASQRKLAMMDVAQKKLTQALQQGYIRQKGDMDHATYLKIAQAKSDLEREIQKAKAKSAGDAQIWSTAGAIGGAVIGGAIGSAAGPMGMAAGANAGAGIGQGLGGIGYGQFGGGQ